MSLVVKVDGTTVNNRFNVQFTDIGSDVGNGEFSLLRDDLQVATLADLDGPDKIVVVSLDGTDMFAWVIETAEDLIIDEGEEAAEIVRFSGRSTAILLDDCVVYPSKGTFDVDAPPELSGLTVVAKPTSPDRYMGWMEPEFDDSGWAAATVIEANEGATRAEGQPDGDSDWIWYEAASGGAHAAGQTMLARDTFTPVSSDVFSVKVIYAGRDDVEAYLDGVLVEKTDPARETDVGTHAREAVVEINGALPHTLAFKVQHLNGSKKAGLTYVVYEHNTDTVLARSDTSTVVLDATDEPGMTPGEVMNQLIDEGQTRGWEPDFATSFNSTDCSRSGEDWATITGAFEVRVGDTLLDVVNQLAEGWVEWTVEPGTATYVGRLLAMWNALGVDAPDGAAPGRGGDSGVTFTEGVNCTKLHYTRRRTAKNHVLIEWGDGQLDGGISASESTYGRKESFLSISNVRNGPSAIRTAVATLTPLSTPATSIVVEIQPDSSGEIPYIDFNIGDSVDVSSAALTDSFRVVAITMQEDENGYLTWLPELATATDIYQQRQQRWLRRTANGTLDGQSRSATPSSEHILSSGKVQVREDTFSTGGGDEVAAGDIGTNVRIRNAPFLIYRMTAEANVAGVSGDTDIELTIDAAGTGEVVTLPDSGADGSVDINPPILIVDDQYMNIEATAAGGHTGVNVTVYSVPTE